MSGYALGSFHLQRLFLLQGWQNSMNRQCIRHELVCWLMKKALRARSQVGYNDEKYNFELWYRIMLEFIWWTSRKVDTNQCRFVDWRLRNTVLKLWHG